ncbi:MAG: hypothetical protein IPM83_08180 [Ignavibacteria bacterium]|nr:hypothetical protein [Ignavibacteria bacterium]
MIYLLLLLCSLLLSCSSDTSTTPDAPQNSALTMEKITDLPYSGGNVTSVFVMDDSKILAVIDGRVATFSTSGGAPSYITSPAGVITAVAGNTGEIYALTNDDLWVIDAGGAVMTKRSDVYSRTGLTEGVFLTVAPNGQPYLRVLQYPSSMITTTSTDRGTTWTTVNLPAGRGGLAFGPNNVVCVSSPSSFQISNDAGNTWQKHPAVVANYGGELLVRSNGDIVYYIPTGGGLWTSSNSGASFTNVNPFNASPFHVKIMEGADGHLYSLIQERGGVTGDAAARLMRSTDGGSTWSHVLFASGQSMDVRGNVVAVGFGETSSGGIAVSRNMAATFSAGGAGQPRAMQSMGFTSTNELVLMADKGLYVRGSAGWRALGAMSTFTNFASTPTGAMYASGLKTSFASSDNGTTWTSVTMPDVPVVGTGYIQTPVLCGLSNGEALVSLTYFRTDLYKHTNGILSRIRSNGQITQIANASNFVWMLQDPSGRIYSRTDNFVSNRESIDNGNSFLETTKRAPGIAFTSTSKTFDITGVGGYSVGDATGTTKADLKLNGFTPYATAIVKAAFDSQNKLYLLTGDQGLFVSTTGL